MLRHTREIAIAITVVVLVGCSGSSSSSTEEFAAVEGRLDELIADSLVFLELDDLNLNVEEEATLGSCGGRYPNRVVQLPDPGPEAAEVMQRSLAEHWRQMYSGSKGFIDLRDQSAEPAPAVYLEIDRSSVSIAYREYLTEHRFEIAASGQCIPD